MSRLQARRGNGRFTPNTMENTFGLHCAVCQECRSLNPSRVGEPRPTHCHKCGAPLICERCERERPDNDDRQCFCGAKWGEMAREAR